MLAAHPLYARSSPQKWNSATGLCPSDFDYLPLGQLTRLLLLLRDCHGTAAFEGGSINCHKGDLAALILNDKTHAFLFIRHSSKPARRNRAADAIAPKYPRLATCDH